MSDFNNIANYIDINKIPNNIDQYEAMWDKVYSEKINSIVQEKSKKGPLNNTKFNESLYKNKMMKGLFLPQVISFFTSTNVFASEEYKHDQNLAREHASQMVLNEVRKDKKDKNTIDFFEQQLKIHKYITNKNKNRLGGVNKTSYVVLATVALLAILAFASAASGLFIGLITLSAIAVAGTLAFNKFQDYNIDQNAKSGEFKSNSLGISNVKNIFKKENKDKDIDQVENKPKKTNETKEKSFSLKNLFKRNKQDKDDVKVDIPPIETKNIESSSNLEKNISLKDENKGKLNLTQDNKKAELNDNKVKDPNIKKTESPKVKSIANNIIKKEQKEGVASKSIT